MGTNTMWGSFSKWVTNSTGKVVGFLLPDGSTRYTSYIVAQWGVPCGVAPSGTIGNNGALTLGTALSRTYQDGVYLYFPADAISSGSAAGFYWCVMSSTTAGTIYNNTFTGIPSYVASPTAFVTTGPGAYTGVTTEITCGSFTLPGGSMGANGRLTGQHMSTYPSNANAKLIKGYLGDSVAITTASVTTTLILRQRNTTFNAGSLGVQVNLPGLTEGGGTAAAPPQRFAVDTSVDQTVKITAQTTAATDFIVVENASFSVEYQD